MKYILMLLGTLYIDIAAINGKQYIHIEKNGVTTYIPASNKDLENYDAIQKKVCSVLKCKGK